MKNLYPKIKAIQTKLKDQSDCKNNNDMTDENNDNISTNANTNV